MKFLVVEADSFVPYAVYEASAAKPEDYQVEGKTFLHCQLQAGANPSYCNIINDNGTWKATPKIDAFSIGQILAKNEEYAKGLLAEFAAENKLLGITDAQTATLIENHSFLIQAVKMGYFPTAIYMIKNMPSEKKDGTFVTDARLLKIVNKLESFSGLPQSSSL